MEVTAPPYFALPKRSLAEVIESLPKDPSAATPTEFPLLSVSKSFTPSLESLSHACAEQEIPADAAVVGIIDEDCDFEE